MALFICGVAHGEVMTDSTVMRGEADAFLANMPAGLQQRQAYAVEAAINGDSRVLEEVRNSRNSAPCYSDNVRVSEMSVTGRNGRVIPMRMYVPALTDEEVKMPLLVYFHGGGWTFGSLNSCASFCDGVASSGKVKVLAVDYALAPEHPYPEGLNDCVDAVKYAFEHDDEWGVDPKAISLGGDSSGGNLALCTALYNLENGCLPIKSIVAFYPVVKAENDDSESWVNYGEGFGLDAELMNRFNEAYCLGGTSENPFISPAFAPGDMLKRLPPVLMINAERDILASQGEAFAQHLSDSGCGIRHITLPGTVHLFITVGGQPRAFEKSLDHAVSFLCE